MEAEPRSDRLRLLVAELEGELERAGRLVAEFERARTLLARPECEVLTVYGAAALLESYYTGAEKTLKRIAATLGGMPSGENWHRALLASMALAIDGLRPAVLSAPAIAALDPFLAFRHRFRNLYVFELERAPMLTLLERGPATHDVFSADIHAFIARLKTWIVDLDAG
ncbi:MAG: hypothetical protein R3F39_07520 [Myxococcota bacterium]